MNTAPERSPFTRAAGWLQKKLFAGFLALFPLAATIWVGRRVLAFLDGIIGKYIQVPGLGIVALFLLLLLTGILVTSYVGLKILSLNERLVTYIPFARTIYSGAKQIVEALSPEGRKGFQRVVMVEYPRKGLWTIGLVTQAGTAEMNAHAGARVSHVLLPHSPNATSGVLLQIPDHELLPLQLSVEEGLKLIISGGLVGPGVSSVPIDAPPDQPI